MPNRSNLIRDVRDLARIVMRVTDNSGATADRYTVCFAGDCLCLSDNPTHPQGVSMSGGFDPRAIEAMCADPDDPTHDIALTELPPTVLQHVIDRTNEAFRDFMQHELSSGNDREWHLENLEHELRCFCGPELQRNVLGVAA